MLCNNAVITASFAAVDVSLTSPDYATTSVFGVAQRYMKKSASVAFNTMQAAAAAF